MDKKSFEENISKLKEESAFFVMSAIVPITILTFVSFLEFYYTALVPTSNISQTINPYVIAISFVMMFVLWIAYWKIFNTRIRETRKMLPSNFMGEFDGTIFDAKIGILLLTIISIVMVVALALTLSVVFGVFALILVTILWSFNLPEKEFKDIEDAIDKSIEKSSDIF